MTPRVVPDDEMRAILGLPDVPIDIKRAAVARRFRMFAEEFSAALAPTFQAIGEAAKRIAAALDLADGSQGDWMLVPNIDESVPALPRPSTSPPMWAHNPTNARRPRA